MDNHVIAEAVHNLYRAVKNKREAKLAGFSISPDSDGYANALFVDPSNPTASHEFSLKVGGGGYELRFGDAALLCAAIQPWEDRPVHIFGAAAIDCRQKGELIFTVALSVVRDLVSETAGMWAPRAKLLYTHINFALRALRGETESKQLPAEVAREVGTKSNEVPWSELVHRVAELRAESERTGMPVFGPVQDSDYRLSAPTKRTLEEHVSMLEQVRKLKDSCDNITVKSRKGWPAGKVNTQYGHEPTGFEKDTFYDIAGLLTERGRAPWRGPPLLEEYFQRVIADMGISEGSTNDMAHAHGYGLVTATRHVHDEVEMLVKKADAPQLHAGGANLKHGKSLDIELRGNVLKSGLYATNNVEAVIGGSTYDWFRVNTGPNCVARVAQLVEIDELTLTFEFRDSLDGKRTTSKIHFVGYASMKDALQRIVGDPFRTENSVFTKRFGVDLPYDND